MPQVGLAIGHAEMFGMQKHNALKGNLCFTEHFITES